MAQPLLLPSTGNERRVKQDAHKESEEVYTLRLRGCHDEIQLLQEQLEESTRLRMQVEEALEYELSDFQCHSCSRTGMWPS